MRTSQKMYLRLKVDIAGVVCLGRVLAYAPFLFDDM